MTPLYAAPLLLTVLAAIAAQRAPGALDWQRAEEEIHRLPPGAFPNLPSAILEELDRRRCTIPQADGYPEPHNVITGKFTDRQGIDWAVLCSSGGASSILVFKGGSVDGVSILDGGPDSRWLQTVGEGRIGYSRRISPVSRREIVRYQKERGGAKPPPIDHEGIEDSFVGKASVIRYCYKGTWLRLTGAD